MRCKAQKRGKQKSEREIDGCGARQQKCAGRTSKKSSDPQLPVLNVAQTFSLSDPNLRCVWP